MKNFEISYFVDVVKGNLEDDGELLCIKREKIFGLVPQHAFLVRRVRWGGQTI